MTTLGVHGKRHNLRHANVDKQAHDRQMPCKGCNLPIAPAQIRWPWYLQGPVVSTSLLEIAKPLFLSPQNFLTEGIPTFRKISSSLSYLLLQLGSNDEEASLPEKGATEATSCPKGGDVEILIWTDPGLGQYYIRNGTLRQVLPKSREESCQQSLTECSARGKTQVYQEGNLTVEEYTYGITHRESSHMDT